MRKDLALELRGDPRTMGGPSSPGFSGTFCRPGASSPVLRGSLPIPRMDEWIHPQCLTLQTAWGVRGCRWGVCGSVPQGPACQVATVMGLAWHRRVEKEGFIPCMYKCKE